MRKKNLNKPFRCPICHTVKPWGDIEKHMAYSEDYEHQQWRIAHGFPSIIPFGYLHRYEPKFRIAVISDFTQEAESK